MRCALVIKGAVGSKTGKYTTSTSSTDLNAFVDYEFCAQQIFKHIINCNKDVQFDIFIQSWSVSLEQQLIEIYKPVSTSFINDTTIAQELKNKHKGSVGSTFAEVSMCKGWEYAVNLVRDYVINTEVQYNIVIVWRIDALLWKDIKITNYNVKDKIYCTKWKWPDWSGELNRGDFHFVMNYTNFLHYYHMYSNISNTFIPFPHSTLLNYTKKHLNIILTPDNIRPGLHSGIMRNIHSRFNYK